MAVAIILNANRAIMNSVGSVEELIIEPTGLFGIFVVVSVNHSFYILSTWSLILAFRSILKCISLEIDASNSQNCVNYFPNV